MKKNEDFTPSEIEELKRFLEELSERVRNGNMAVSDTVGSVIDVSPGGVKITCADASVIERVLSQNMVLCELLFNEDHPLIVSGSPVYIYQRDGDGYIIGIDFSGSRFGPHIVNVLPNHVRHFLHHRRK